MRSAARDPTRRRILLVGFLAFALLGAIQAMYGPAFPGLTERFGVGIDRVGLTVSLHFAGSFLGIATSGFWLRRFGYRRVMGTGAGLMAAGAAAVAFAPTWGLVLSGALLAGLGFGLLDIAFNLLPARVFEPNAAPALNLLNAFFGVGAVLGPVAVGLAGSTLQGPFAGLALLTLVVAILVLRLPEPPRQEGAGNESVPWLTATGFTAMYFLYVAGEVGVGSWETVHLEPSLGARNAAFATSLYWGALTLGRLVATPISARLRPRTLVLGAGVLGLAGLAAAHATAFAPVAYAITGLAFAPIFPTGLAWLQRVFPRRSEQVAPIVVAASNLGPVTTAGAIGAVVAWRGPEVVPTLLTGLASGLVVVILALWWGTRRA